MVVDPRSDLGQTETASTTPAGGVSAPPSVPHSEPAWVGELHRAHYRALVQLAALMVDSQALAEEIVQDVFADLVRRRPTIEPDLAVNYLRRSVANRARSALRRLKTRRAHRLTAPVPVGSAESAVLRAAGFETLLAGVAALPLRQRQVLVLRYFAESSIAETAEALGISEAAVTTSTHRALRALAPLREELR